MNVQANSVFGSNRTIAPASLPPARRFYWALRRELWEYRSIYIAPLAVAVIVLIGSSLHLRRLPGQMRLVGGANPSSGISPMMDTYNAVGALILATTILVAVFYCIDTLYGERRDRSILFWKSLPVSDTMTVLAKAAVALVIIPLAGFVVTVVTEFIVLLASSAIVAASGQSVVLLWQRLPFFRLLGLLLYHVTTVHIIWPAPLFCWILLVSAWARRAPFLWAFVPPVAIVYLEKIVFGSRHFLDYLLYRLMGNGMEAVTAGDAFPTGPTTHVTPWVYLTSFGLWAGLAASAIFLALAVRVRRSQGPA